MKSLYKNLIKSLILCVIVSMAGFLTSCEDDDVDSGQVVLLSFGPSGVVHGDEITFVGENLDKVSSIILQPDVTIESSEFLDASSSSFKVIVPDGAEAGKVMLNTPNGQVESKTILNFLVDVEIASITEEVKPGTNLTITGDKLNWIEQITFSSDLEVNQSDFVSLSQTELVVTVPMEAQTGYLIFAAGGTDPMTFGSEEELIVTLPAVTSMNPASLRHDANLTISGTDLDLVTELVFGNDVTVASENFESQSVTEIVVTVPAPVESGTITLKQASPVDVVTEEELMIVLPVGTDISPVPVEPGVESATITGTDLDLIDELILPSAGAVSSEDFTSHTATEIVFPVPTGTENGAVGYTTIHGYENATLGVTIVVPGEGPPPLPLTVYDDELFFSGQDWSWGASSTDPASAEAFYSGMVSFKHVVEGGDGGLQIGNLSGVDASAQNSFSFSLYGGPGTEGASVAAILNSEWGNYNAVTLAAGKWTEYSIDKAMYPDVDFSNITQIAFKIEGTSGGEILYADRIGFDDTVPAAPLAISLFDASIHESMEPGGWGMDYTEFGSTENPRPGSDPYSVKVDFPGGWSGGGQLVLKTGESNIPLDGATTFVFSIYGGDGTDGQNIQVNLKLDADNPQQVTIVEGEWTEYEIPVATFDDYSEFAELWFQDTDWSGTVYIDHIGLR